MSRINNPEACIVCSRRTDGMAVGRPTRLGWYFLATNAAPPNALSALSMKNMDDVEQRACVMVAAEVNAGNEITIPATELPAFIAWCVKAFAENMRRDIENGGAPF